MSSIAKKPVTKTVKKVKKVASSNTANVRRIDPKILANKIVFSPNLTRMSVVCYRTGAGNTGARYEFRERGAFFFKKK